MEKKCNVFCVTYEDGTKDCLIVFSDNTDKEIIQRKIVDHLKQVHEDIYTQAELTEAAQLIINGDVWANGCDAYYFESCELF